MDARFQLSAVLENPDGILLKVPRSSKNYLNLEIPHIHIDIDIMSSAAVISRIWMPMGGSRAGDDHIHRLRRCETDETTKRWNAGKRSLNCEIWKLCIAMLG